VSWSVAGTARCGNAQVCARRVTTDRGSHVMHIGWFAILPDPFLSLPHGEIIAPNSIF
jgi:hypothetical protein